MDTEMDTADYVQPLKGKSPPQKVGVSSNENFEEAKFLESYDKPIPIHSSIAKKLGITALPVRMDSQEKYAAVSRGDVEIYLRFTLSGHRETTHLLNSLLGLRFVA